MMNVSKLIDEHPVGRLQLRIFAICSAVAFFDGYDTQAVGYAASLLAAAAKIPITSFGIVFSVGLAGAAVGAFALGPLADRYGRKWPLIFSCALFALFNFTTIYATSYAELITMRFLTGLGLGGAIPASLALIAEYFPSRVRGLAVTAMFSAFPFGGFIGGLVASFLIDRFGWQSIFLIGSVLPALLCVALALWVPDSIGFMIARGRKALARETLALIAPNAGGSAFELEPLNKMHGLRRELFRDNRLPITLLLWAPFFMGFMVIITVVLWGPALLRESGVPLATAAIVFAFHYLGGFIGTAASGYLVDKFGPAITIIPAFLLGALSLIVFGHLADSAVLLSVDAFLAGLFVVGAANGLLSIAASLYPTSVRSTGIGWAMGMGRVGQLIGPVLVGLMLSKGQAASNIFAAAAIPCVLSAIFVLAIALVQRRRIGGVTAEGTLKHIGP